MTGVQTCALPICTGSHYSGPTKTIEANYAMLLHAAFWGEVTTNGVKAAPALLYARKIYDEWLVKNRRGLEAIEIARRLKNRAQFTCLGLGW